MRKRLLPEAAYYTNKNKLHSIWRKFVRFMACIVVFCTTYALILPAITMEKTRCGIEEHTHSESCYAKQTQRQITMPACTVDSLGVHTHTEACYDADGGLLCGYADFLVHEHDASCMDESGELLCRLPEVKNPVV